MAAALTAPFAVAAVVLCAAGLAKLRAPNGAVRALMVTGLPARAGFVRALAVGELVIGGLALVRPSPLLAGVIADADQAAGGSIGFLNPTLYQVDTHHAPAFNDIVPAANPDATAVIRVDYLNTVNKSSGFVVSLRAIDYQGVETYCDGTGNCASRLVTVNTASGFDGMTGIGTVGTAFIRWMAAA